ncbi:ComEA family DNA-binding protein, partial [Mycobacterium asiaticum]|uniref:ComEA family DNA-binding protein n=1 Tax=Mycobacterium asiaticum TaxID=1790 RepID=UPI0012DB5FD3
GGANPTTICSPSPTGRAMLRPMVSAPSTAPTTSGKPRNGPKPEVLDLNAATVEQLDALPGVGPVTAAAIVAWRQANGRFTTVDQLAEVEGIGPARLDKLRALVRV